MAGVSLPMAASGQGFYGSLKTSTIAPAGGIGAGLENAGAQVAGFASDVAGVGMGVLGAELAVSAASGVEKFASQFSTTPNATDPQVLQQQAEAAKAKQQRQQASLGMGYGMS